MSELNQEDLLEWLEQAHKYFTFEPPGKDNPAYQQIKELIQKPGVIPEKRALTIDEVISKYPESVRILLNELVQKLDALQKKPEVDEEFVEKWNQVIAERVNVQMKRDFIREEISLVYPGTENLAQMLGEAGVKVVRK